MEIILIVIFITLFSYCICIVFSKLTIGVCKSNSYLGGKTAIVTGGKSGLGYETALNLASRGCKVIIADILDASDKIISIKNETGNPNVVYKHLNLASLESVRTFSQDILKTEKRLDILINNAGCGGFEGVYTSDGLLRIMQINYFGHFLLTHLLIGLLKKSSKGRIVFTSSIFAFFNQVTSANDITIPMKIKWGLVPALWDYGNSKLCMLIASNIFADKLRKYGIKVNALHPGVVRTPLCQLTLQNSSGNTFEMKLLITLQNIFGKTPREGCQTILHCAMSENVDTGGYYVDCVKFLQPSAAKDLKISNEIWKLSEQLVKLNPGEKI